MQLTKQKQSKAEKTAQARLCLSNVQLYNGIIVINKTSVVYSG